MRRALIVGLSGTALTSEEAAFLARAQPCGVIVFARNIVSAGQLRALLDDCRVASANPSLLTLVDQEGGRVRRLRPPEFRDLPAAARLAELYASDPEGACRAARVIAELTASDLRAVGLDTNCVPCADVPVAGADAIIGDRAYGHEPAQVAQLAGAVAQGHIAGGVLPVVKHIPGHGRADADSHLALPVVRATEAELEATDFAAFRALSHLPAAMTAHVVYTSIDQDVPASTSHRVVDRIIRGAIGFDGLLMCDDLSMKALSGGLGERAASVISAGCDVALHCSGNLAEMEEVAAAVPILASKALERLLCCTEVTRAEPAPMPPERRAEAGQWLLQLGASPFPIESV
ncbi:MAG: beta-N-acetylhexosaminidase [Hyphomicrobiaceae bacterium]|nr:beta-N-acetylhexosaminidase [Hyphomicrobiaceae bacterium]